jgi:hypothetical protein
MLSYARLLHDRPAERLHAGDVGEVCAIYPLNEGSDEMLDYVRFWRSDAVTFEDGVPDLDDAYGHVDLRADEFAEATGE